MRDSARFHFGFTVPYITHPSAAAVIEAVATSRGDLGVFRLDQGATSGAWWRTLAGQERPKIIARLPFIERPDHPAGTPVFVISKPLADASLRDVVLYAAQFERWHKGANEALIRLGGEVVASAADANGLSELIAVPGTLEPSRLHNALTEAGASLAQLVEVGSHAERFHVK
jgi:hypothetical protein